MLQIKLYFPHLSFQKIPPFQIPMNMELVLFLPLLIYSRFSSVFFSNDAFSCSSGLLSVSMVPKDSIRTTLHSGVKLSHCFDSEQKEETQKNPYRRSKQKTQNYSFCFYATHPIPEVNARTVLHIIMITGLIAVSESNY